MIDCFNRFAPREEVIRFARGYPVRPWKSAETDQPQFPRDISSALAARRASRGKRRSESFRKIGDCYLEPRLSFPVHDLDSVSPLSVPLSPAPSPRPAIAWSILLRSWFQCSLSSDLDRKVAWRAWNPENVRDEEDRSVSSPLSLSAISWATTISIAIIVIKYRTRGRVSIVSYWLSVDYAIVKQKCTLEVSEELRARRGFLGIRFDRWSSFKFGNFLSAEFFISLIIIVVCQ